MGESAGADLAILFWFYKEPAVCENRLELLARHNGDLPTYGLYGGDPGAADEYRTRLLPRLGDLYAAPAADEQWKWLNGDLMLLDWYQQRGRALAWEQVAIVQWDLLVLGPLRAQFPGLQPGQMCLPDLRRLDASMEASWYWTRQNGRQYEYVPFRRHIQAQFGHDRHPLSCHFMFAIIPRAFFERLAGVPGKEFGMVEYRCPTYAEIFGIPFYEKDFGGDGVMNATRREIGDDFIRDELAKPEGRRLFHPYFRSWT
jgi:hypothetical protein